MANSNNDVQKTFRFNFDFNKKDVKKQLKDISGDVADFIKNMGEASDKVNIFKDLVSYVSNVDKALSDFKSKNKDVFQQIFGSLDADLKKHIEGMFGLDDAKMTLLNDLRKQIDDAEKSGNKLKKLKNIAQSINDLYASTGSSKRINMDMFNPRATSTPDKLDALKGSLDDIMYSFGKVQDLLRNGFSVGGTGAGAGGFGGDIIDIDAIKQQISDLEAQVQRYRDLINEFNDIGRAKISLVDGNLDGDFVTDYTVESVQTLIKTYRQARDEVEKLKKAGDTSSASYFENLSKMSTAAIKLQDISDNMSGDLEEELEGVQIKNGTLLGSFENIIGEISDFIDNSFDDIFKDIPNRIQNAISEAGAQMSLLQDKLKVQSGTGDIGAGGDTGKKDDSKNIRQEIELYQQLKSNVEKYYKLLEERIKFDEGSDDYNRLERELQGIVEDIRIIKQLDGRKAGDLTDIFGDIEYEGVKFEDTIKNLCTLLEIEVPDSIKSAESTLLSFLNMADEFKERAQDSMEDIQIGIDIEKLECGKQELKELSEQSLISAEDFERASLAYVAAMDELNFRQERNKAHIKYLEDNQGGGGYYTYDYYSDYQEEKARADHLEAELQRKAENKIINKADYVEILSNKFEKLFDNVNSMSGTIEYKILINGKEIDIKQGHDKGISVQEDIETYLGSLNKNTIVSAHNHPGGASSDFNAVDVKSIMDDVYNGVAKVGMVVSEHDISTLNLAGVDIVDAFKALKEIEKLDLSHISSDQINEIFTSINSTYQNVAQKWDKSQFKDLAGFIFDIGMSAENAIDPLTKFQNILKIATGGKIDLSKYKDLFDTFNVENTGKIFNQIMKQEGLALRVEDLNTASLDEFVNKINQQKEVFVNLRKEADITYSKIRNNVQSYIDYMNMPKDERLAAQDPMDGFIKKYFGRHERDQFDSWLYELENGEATVNQITNRIAGYFDRIDPSEYLKDDFTKISTGHIDDNIEKAKIALQDFFAMTKEIQDKSLTLYGAEDNVEIGKYIERLESAREVLRALGEQGLITAEDLNKVDSEFKYAKDRLDAYTVHYDGYGSGYGDYSYTYYDEYQQAQDENNVLRGDLEKAKEEIERLQKELQQKTGGAGIVGDGSADGTSGEIQRLELLLDKIKDINAAVDLKTASFKEEADVVGKVVAQEIESLQLLYSNLEQLGAIIKSSMTDPIDQLPAKIEALCTQISALGQNFMEIKNAIDGLLSDLNVVTGKGAGKQFTIKLDANDLNSGIDAFKNQLDSSAKQIVDSSDHLQVSVDNLNKTMQNQNAADPDAEKAQQIDVMKKNLLEMFNKVKAHNNRDVGNVTTDQETQTEFFADGTARFSYAEGGTVPWSKTMEAVLSNIMSQSIMSVHSHPWGEYFGTLFGNDLNDIHKFSNDTFSGSTGDLAAWETLQRYGSQIGAMITGNILHAFDITKIGDRYPRFIKHLRDVEKEYSQDPEYSRYVKTNKEGKTGLGSQTTLADFHKELDVFKQMVRDALSRMDFSDQEIGDIYKEYDLTNDNQLTELATTLVNLSSAAQSAESPIDALRQLLIRFGTLNAQKEVRTFGRQILFTDDNSDIGGADEMRFSMVIDTIKDFMGDSAEFLVKDLTDMFDSGEFKELGRNLIEISRTMGADIEGANGQAALEALRKGEVSVADVWNNFSDFAKVSQEAIDKMQVIDTSSVESTEVQLMSRIADSLSSIENKVSAIEVNTQQTTQDNLDVYQQALGKLKYDDTSLLLGKKQSWFDENNITEFYARELDKAAQEARSNFNDLYGTLADANAFGTLSATDVQALFDSYLTAVQRTQDALNQVNAYNKNYNTYLTNEEYGTTISDDLVSELRMLIDYNGDIVKDLQLFVSNAKGGLTNTSPSSSRDSYDSYRGDTSDLTQVLSNLFDVSERLLAKLGSSSDFVRDNNVTAISEKRNPLESVDISSEVAQCNDLLAILGQIEDAIYLTMTAFRAEKTVIDELVPLEVQTLQKLGEYLYELESLVRGLFTNIPTSENMFVAWKNDLADVKNHLDGILTDLQGIKELTPYDGNIVRDNSAKEIGVEQNYALESTLQEVKAVLENIFGSITHGSSLANVANSLTDATVVLKNVASGIVEHSKAQQTDKIDAGNRIANNYGQLSSIASNAVNGLGDEVKIENMKALADNVVRVKGAAQDASGVWKGFIVDINESNQAVVRAVDEQSEFAKSLNASADAAKKEQSARDQFTEKLGAQSIAFDNYRNSLKDVGYTSQEVENKLSQLKQKLQQVTNEDELKAWKTQFIDIKNEITAIKDRWKLQELGKVGVISKSLTEEFKKAGIKDTDRSLTTEQKDLIDKRNDLIIKIKEYEAEVKKENKVSIDAIVDEKDELLKLVDAYKDKYNIANAGSNGNKKAPKESIVRNAQNRYEGLTNRTNTDELKNSTIINNAVAQYTSAFNKLKEIQSKFKIGEVLSQDQEKEFNDARIACAQYARELERLLSVYNKSKEGALHSPLESDFVDTETGRQQALKQFVEDTYGADATIVKFDNDFNKLIYTVDNGDGTFTKMTSTINNTRTAIDTMSGETKEAIGVIQSFWNELKGKFKSIGSYLVASFSFHEVIQVLRQGIQYVREIDSALTELKKVTDETDASYNKFLQDMSNTASVVGSTVADLTTMASEWARLGYSMEEAGKLAKSTAILLNVSEFNDATAASEALISTMQAFEYTADQSQHVVDILNEVGEFIARR